MYSTATTQVTADMHPKHKGGIAGIYLSSTRDVSN